MANDQTGFGFASGGFAPLQNEREDFNRNRYHTSRVIDSMQFIDPYIRNAVESAIRIKVKDGGDAAEVRRAAFGSAQGQGFMDIATALRRTGFLGAGDPVNYAANITQGVAGGGFGMNTFTGTKQTGFNQQVTGNGAIAEQVAMQFAKSTLRNLFGSGTPDPSKNYGFNMEDASGIFSRIAQRGGIGNVAAYKRNATFAERAAAMRQNEVDPSILGGLDGVTEENVKERISQADGRGDKKLAKALKDLSLSTDALAINSESVRKVTDTVRETTKGLASLKEIYGELNSNQLHAQLESLTGQRITTSAQARQANSMVNQLRNAATTAGYDPRAIMDSMTNEGAVAAGTQRWRGHFGLDERHDVSTQRLRSGMETATMVQALQLSKQAEFNAQTMRDRGGNPVDVTLGDIKSDISRNVDVMAQQHPELFYAEGLANGEMSGNTEFRQELETIKGEYRTARTPEARKSIAMKARRLIEKANGGQAFGTWKNSKQAKSAFQKIGQMGLSDLTGMAINAGNQSVSRSTVSLDRLREDFGAAGGDAELTRQGIIEGLGVGGFQQLQKGDGTSQSKEQIDEFLKGGMSGMTAEQTAAFRRTMLGENGELKDPQKIKELLNNLQYSSASGKSLYETKLGAQQRMESDAMEQRKALMDGDGLSVKSIANSLLTGKTKNLDSDDKATAAIQVLQEQGLATFGEVGKMDLRNGMDEKEMAMLRKISGNKDLNYHTELGFKSEADLLKASQTDPQMRERLKELMRTRGDVVLGGTAGETTAVAQGTLDKFREGDYESRFRAAGTMREISGLQPGETNDAMNDIMRYGKVSKGNMAFQHDAWDRSSRGKLQTRRTNGQWDKHFSMDQAGKWANVVKMAGSKEGVGDLAELNSASGGGMADAMQKQLEVMWKARKEGVTKLDTWDSEGKRTSLDINDQTIKDMQAALKAVKEATEALGKGSEKSANFENVTIKHATIERQD